MEVLKTWQFWTLLIAIGSLLWSIINSIVGKAIATKIMENDLQHLEKSVEEIKTEYHSLSEKTYNELKKIFRRLGIIEKQRAVDKAICDERHNKNNNKKKK